MKGRAKNDNLKKYQEEKIKRNTELIKRAIGHIRGLGGDISMSIVSRVTYEIANPEHGEKGITLAGISKNKQYRTMIEQAQADAMMHHSEKHRHSIRPRHLSDGDIRMMLHALRVENETLKRENKILTHQLKEAPHTIETVQPIEEKLIKEHNALHNAMRSLVGRLCELDVAYIDLHTETLKLMAYKEVIVPKEMLLQFYEKELHELKTGIR